MFYSQKPKRLSARYSADLARTMNVIAERRDYRLPDFLLMRGVAALSLVFAAVCLISTARPSLFPSWVPDAALVVTAIFAVVIGALHQHSRFKILPLRGRRAIQRANQWPNMERRHQE